MIARYVAKWGITQMCLCETQCQGPRVYRTNLGGVLTFLKRYREIRGIAAIVSQYRNTLGRSQLLWGLRRAPEASGGQPPAEKT